MFEEIKNIKTTKQDIKSFGITIGVILFVVAFFLYYHGNNSYQIISVIAGVFILCGLIIPKILMPFYMIWMTFAVILGWIMTRIILSVIFYIIITPISLITKLFGEDFLDLEHKDKESYWNYRDIANELSQDYEKQY